MTVPLSFGLIMAGFAGHAVFPTVHRDMENPKRYESMVNLTYLTTTAVYFGVAACGYLMFGSQTMQEVRDFCFSLLFTFSISLSVYLSPCMQCMRHSV